MMTVSDANVQTGLFVTKMFHPNVAANGEICVNTLKKDWKSDLGIGHILLVTIFTYVHHSYFSSQLVLTSLRTDNQMLADRAKSRFSLE